MPLRLVADALGTACNVWHVTPHEATDRSTLVVASPYASGWLAFEQTGLPVGAPAEKRRPAPVPADWETASDRATGLEPATSSLGG